MKTTIILISSLLGLIFNHLKVSAQFQVKDARQYCYDNSALLKSYDAKSNSNSTSSDYNQYNVKELPSTAPVKMAISTTRVIAYYEEGYGNNITWETMSIKVTVETNSYGKDEINVISYKKNNSDYWTDVSYATVSKTYGNMAKEFTYQAYVGGKTVYFTI